MNFILKLKLSEDKDDDDDNGVDYGAVVSL